MNGKTAETSWDTTRYRICHSHPWRVEDPLPGLSERQGADGYVGGRPVRCLQARALAR
jgi:hypothetical protein